MTTPARKRLAATAAAAGYPPRLWTLIAEATLPSYRPGQRLTDADIDRVRGAIETLAQAGRSADRLPVTIAAYQRRHGHAWRQAFWRRMVRGACLRHAHPDIYGVSPCDSGREPLAMHGQEQGGAR